MLASRSGMLRKIAQQIKIIPKSPATFQVRNSGGWSYRTAPPPSSKKAIICAEVFTGVAIWWVLWHIWTQPGHIVGEWPEVIPSAWSDEELGIPPDTEGQGKRVQK